MANPTSNFGWQMPTNTDLVKDLPADFEVFGQAVDTSLMDLKGGTTGQVLSKASNTDMDFTWVAQDDSNAIQNALLTTTGDTIYASGASTPARLGIGTTGQVLTVSAGGVPSWATPSSGSMTLLSTTTLSGNSTSITGISGSYNNLEIWIQNFYATISTTIEIRLNGSANITNYNYQFYDNLNGAGGNNGTQNYDIITSDCPTTSNPSATNMNLKVYQYANTSFGKPYTYIGGHRGNVNGVWMMAGLVKTTSAISSITLKLSNGSSTFSGGTVLIYGVK